MRYVGRAYKGRNGEVLYPGAEDPDLTFEIDDVMESAEEFIGTYVNFLIPFLPGYKDKDEHFTQFIIKHFPAFLKKLEERLTKNAKKYLVADHMTVADIAVAANLFKMPYNDNYANQHIL